MLGRKDDTREEFNHAAEQFERLSAAFFIECEIQSG
jgi:hypothetical protein